MKKICLSLVLTVVSIFSISAQTPEKSTAVVGAVEDVKAKPASTETVIKTVETTDKTSQTNSPAEQKAQTLEAVKKPQLPEAPKTEAVKPETKPETPETQKPQVIEPEKKPELPILTVKKISLGTISTGSATIDGYIEEFCELYSVDPLLIYAQMSQESSFKAKATSAKGASGFMQLMPDTARRFGVTNIYNPKQNIKAGVKYMRWLLDKFGGDMRLALAGYNAGEGSVIKYGNKIPPFRETQNYVARIMNHYELITNPNSTFAENAPQLEK